jgi:hypothetical protein
MAEVIAPELTPAEVKDRPQEATTSRADNYGTPASNQKSEGHEETRALPSCFLLSNWLQPVRTAGSSAAPTEQSG